LNIKSVRLKAVRRFLVFALFMKKNKKTFYHNICSIEHCGKIARFREFRIYEIWSLDEEGDVKKMIYKENECDEDLALCEEHAREAGWI